MDHHNPNPNGPNPTKSAMAMNFMQALTNIQQRPTSPVGRSWRIKRAAYTSMVVAAGLTRAWSQAVLRRLHGGRRRVRTLQRVPLPQRRIRVRVRVRVPIRASNNRIERLRRLLPGGRAMELGNLLEETASYVQCLRDQAKAFQPNDGDDDSDDDYTDDEELHSPIDEVDPFVFFVETIKGSNLPRFQNLMQTLDFHHQALASGIAQHAEQRKVEIEKEKMEKATAS